VARAGGLLSRALQDRVQYENAWCLRKLGRSSDAEAAYRALMQDADPPAKAQATAELADLLASQGHCDTARPLLEKLHAADGGLAALPPDTQARALYRLGACASEAGDADKSLAALEEMLSASPKHALAGSAHYLAGEASFKLQRYEKAAEHFTRVIDDSPQDEAYAPSLLRLGDSQVALQRWDAAEKTFLRFLRERPKDDTAYQAEFGVAWARENLKQYDDAIAAYHSVAEHHSGPTAARAQFQIGECRYAQRRFDDAVAEFMKVDILYAYPEWSAAALFEAGRAFEQLDKVGEARRQYEAVRDKYADSKWAGPARQRLDSLAATPRPAAAVPADSPKTVRSAATAEEK
jgi:TolA-binding protein